MAETLWTSEEIVAATGGKLAGKPFAATGVSIDTRTLEPGDLFVALGGVRADHAGQRPDLLGVVHADLEDRPLGVARHARQGQRYADVVVVGLHRRMRPAGELQPGQDRLGHTGLAD